jgi:anion-transporting  ArsA/GET3 family ATPase
MARNAAATGRRVLAVDAIGSGGLADVLLAADPSVPVRSSTSTAEPRPGEVEVLTLTTRESLDQYLKIYLKLPLGPSRLGPLAKIFDYVSAAAPGVRELLIIGKIGWEVRTGQWDDIIVDGPATGHVVELLTAPESMAELVPTGPLAQQTDWLGDVLAAPSSEVVLVTIPEELPVTESGELLARLRTEASTAVTLLVVNKAPVPLGPAGLAEAERVISSIGAVSGSGAPGRPAAAAVAGAVDLARSRHLLAAAQQERLARLDLPTVTVVEHPADPITAVEQALAERGTAPN